MTKPEIRHQIVSLARSWVGQVRFRHQGRDPENGLDCAGVVIRIAHDLQLSDFDIVAYPRIPDGRGMKDLLDREMISILRSELLPGDAVLLADNRWPCHLAIVADYPQSFSLIHSQITAGGVIETRLDDETERRIIACYQFPGVRD